MAMRSSRNRQFIAILPVALSPITNAALAMAIYSVCQIRTAILPIHDALGRLRLPARHAPVTNLYRRYRGNIASSPR